MFRRYHDLPVNILRPLPANDLWLVTVRIYSAAILDRIRAQVSGSLIRVDIAKISVSSEKSKYFQGFSAQTLPKNPFWWLLR
jgi:hypothetical protein